MNREDLIQHYFESDLTEEEQQLFDELMLDDPAFREEVVYQQNVKKAISLSERDSLKQFLRTVEHQEKVTPARNSMLYFFASAAAVIVLFVFFYILRSDSNKQPEFIAYYSKYPNIIYPGTRNFSDGNEDAERGAFAAYDRGAFTVADSLFTIARRADKSYISFYTGITKFELQQYDSAIIYFQKYRATESAELRQQSLWYLALANLAQGNSREAKQQLHELHNIGNYKEAEVKQLLDLL